ncbi:solute carrier family 23 protein [Piscinibacter sp. XHJ-5]|uniref:uracil-xanthine permease family protein n=1 Tax=Piscinibacter sp. XHJ-5 TaxID=3037797 RepID=UPI002452D0DF|nr:solute carrier family 23 protein [Piscinibacter sp. XHJ-5]
MAVVGLSALQHVGVAAITLVYPLILARAAGLSGTALIDFVSVTMLAMGVGTVLLCVRSRFIGSGFLCPACFTQIYLGPSLYALNKGGFALVYGMTVVAGILQLGIAPLLHRMRALLPTEIAGLVIAIVGLSLASLGVRYSLGLIEHGTVQPTYLIVAGISVVTMIVLNVWTKGYPKMLCVLIGMVVGYIASAALGMFEVATAVTAELPVVRIPRLQHTGWQFDGLLVAPFLVVAVATTLRAMGDISNAQRLNDPDWVRPGFRSMAGGVASNGIASAFCGLVGTSGVNSYSACVGLSGATGITSRVVGYACGSIFVLFAFVPAIAAAFATMPVPVMGAALFFSSAFVFTAGLQMMTARMLDARKSIVIGLSFGLAVMADIYREVFATVPAALQPIFSNSLVLGTVCAVLLNLVTRIGIRQRVLLRLDPGRMDRDRVEGFFSEHGARWGARHDIIRRATFAAVQVLEVLGDPPAGVEIEASFDEFDLDVRIRYVGAPLLLPQQKPTPQQIMESADGERLLAGYLLRRTADEITCNADTDRVEIHLHYDH